MALLGNYSVLHKSPGKFLTGTVAYGDRANWSKNGQLREIGCGPGMDWSKTALPYGYGVGGVWMLPKVVGAMVSRNVGTITLDGNSLTLSAGQNIDGTTTLSINGSGNAVGVVFMTATGLLTLTGTADAVGGLSGDGSTSFSLLGNASDIVGLLPGSGSASLSLALNAANGTLALLGTGTSSLSLTGAATAVGVVFMTGDGLFTLSGSADASAVINGTGTSSLSLNGNLSDIVGLLPGTGSASLSLSLNAPVGELTLQGNGSASFSIDGNTSTCDLLAQLTGNGTLTLAGLPSNITAALLATGTGTLSINGDLAIALGPAHMTGAGLLSITGAADSIGIGHMTGNTDTGALTPESIAAAVWNALTSAFTLSGSMGEALSSGGISPQTIRDAMTLGTTEIPETDSIDEKLDALQLSTLTAQEVRDAMSLGTVAVPAANSLDLKLNTIGTTTTNTPSQSADAFMNSIVEAGFSVEEVLRFLVSNAAANASGLGTENISFDSLDGSKVRVAGTIVGGVRMITVRDGT